VTDGIIGGPDGATPLADASGLIQTHITNRAQLNEAEHDNIAAAADWLVNGRIDDVFTVTFYRQLHRRMFDRVWRWAGELRTTDKTIGTPASSLPQDLGAVAMKYSREWRSEAGEDALVPFLARYHHELVSVHPFENGNGRWSRLAVDAVVQRLRGEPYLTWATAGIDIETDQRDAYIAALRAADDGDLEPLTMYLATLNPGR